MYNTHCIQVFTDNMNYGIFNKLRLILHVCFLYLYFILYAHLSGFQKYVRYKNRYYYY